jgi:hypothetical protein
MYKLLPTLALSILLTGCLSNVKTSGEAGTQEIAEESDREYRCKRVKKTGSNMHVRQCSKIATTEAERQATQNVLRRAKMKGSIVQRKDQ